MSFGAPLVYREQSEFFLGFGLSIYHLFYSLFYRVILLTENCLEKCCFDHELIRNASVSDPLGLGTCYTQRAKCQTTFSNGCLGSHNDEERSEMRYVMRIAESSESSNVRTHLALPGIPGSMLVRVSVEYISTLVFGLGGGICLALQY